MTTFQSRAVRFAATSAVALALLYGVNGFSAPKQPRLATGEDEEITHDGLYLVDKSVADKVWVKPDLDLTGYTKIMIAPAGVAYRKLDPVNRFQADSESEFPVQEENKARFEQILKEEFTEELEKLERYEIVTEAGPDVLTLVGGVIDVVSFVPPDLDSAKYGRGGVYLESVGSAVLVVELRDSMSGEVLARAADGRAAESPFAFEANSVTVWSEVRRLAQYWANLLVDRLNTFEKI
ncbi:MAG TPA: DUF3313 family protein [Gammaproteobacteria bacterium]|jgi:hypothetical protein